MNSGAVFNNQTGGTFDAQNDVQIFRGTGALSTFNNAGTFQKSAGTGTTTIGGASFPVAFNNTGTVTVLTGTVAIAGGGTSSGSFNSAAGATLTFGNYTSGAGTSFTKEVPR